MVNNNTTKPGIVFLGTEDNSQSEVTPEVITTSLTHVPLCFIFAKDGPTDKVLVTENNFAAIFGSESIKETEKYYTHSTKFLEGILGEGNNCVVQRLTNDEFKKAKTRLYLLVKAIPVNEATTATSYSNRPTVYDRADNGEIVKVGDTYKEITPKVTGVDGRAYILHISYATRTIDGSEKDFGTGSPFTAPSAPDNTTTTVEKFEIPIMDFEKKEGGESGNNFGIRINPFTSAEIPQTYLTEKVLPYNIRISNKSKGVSNQYYIDNIYGEQDNTFSFVPKFISPVTSSRIDLENVITKNYENLNNISNSLKYHPLGKIHIYKENIAKFIKFAFEQELHWLNFNFHSVTSGSDQPSWDNTNVEPVVDWFNYGSSKAEVDGDSRNLLNIANFVSMVNVNIPCLGLRTDNITASDFPADYKLLDITTTSAYQSGGTDPDWLTTDDTITKDGKITKLEKLDSLVQAKMDEYNDSNSPVLNLALNPDNVIYDSGFSLTTKEKLVNYIAKRRASNVILSTYEVMLDNEPQKSASIITNAEQLMSIININPESTYYGTPAARALITVGSIDINGVRYPDTYDLMIKSARMMGSSTGVWDTNFLFDSGGRNIISTGTDYAPRFISPDMEERYSRLNLTYAIPFDRDEHGYPALRTVYSDDTSILSNYFITKAIVGLERLAFYIWQNFTGSIRNKTPNAFLSEVTKLGDRFVDGIFGDLYTVKAIAEMNKADIEKGYSWRFTYKISGSGMKTVMWYTTSVYREGAN